MRSRDSVMTQNQKLTRFELRRLLRAVLPTDSDFTAFCVDFFPDVAERFAGTMDRLSRASLLLEVADAQALVDALQRYDLKRFSLYQRQLSTPTCSTENPYRGLSAFQQDEAHLFFGREALTAQLWQRFESLCEKPDATRLLAILGPSGSGKSSVARAGLLAALAQSPLPGPQPMHFTVFKPGERPMESMARALVPLLPKDATDLPANRQVAIERLLTNKDVPGEGLRRFAANLPQVDRSPLVVLVDQFEELYTLCKDPEERELFVETLLHAASDSGRYVSVVLTLRTDFIGETQRQHAQLNRLISSQHELVPVMSSEELRDAIAKPAEHAGRPIDEATIELLRTETRGNQGALPLLEFALTRIWEGMERSESPGMTLRKIGGVGGALAGEAQKIYNALTEAEKATARRALVRLVRLGEGTRDTRRRALLSELCGRGETASAVVSVLRKFANDRARLVTLGGDGPETVAEVTHEALFEHWAELRAWIEQSRQDRGLHDRAQEAANLWEKDGRPAGRLWRNPDLQLLREYYKRCGDDFTDTQVAFLKSSVWRLRKNRVMLVVISAAIIPATSRAFALYQSREALRNQAKIDGYAGQLTQMVMESEFAMDLKEAQSRPDDNMTIKNSLAYYRATIRGRKIPSHLYELISHLRTDQQENDSLLGFIRRPVDGSFTFDGKLLLIGSGKSGRIFGFDAFSGNQIEMCRIYTREAPIVELSQDGRLIAITNLNSNDATIYDYKNGCKEVKITGHNMEIQSLRFSPDSHRLVTASMDGTARIWDSGSGAVVMELRGHKSWVNRAEYSHDGTRIVTSSMDRTAKVWDSSNGRLLADLIGHKSWVFGAEFDHRGQRIATYSGDGTSRIWDAHSRKLLFELQGHTKWLNSARFSHDDRFVSTSSADGTVRIWDATTGDVRKELRGHTSWVNSAEFSSNGDRLVTASGDGTARVWSTQSGNLLFTMNAGNWIYEAKFSPDGRSISTIEHDCQASIWSSEDGRLLRKVDPCE